MRNGRITKQKQKNNEVGAPKGLNASLFFIMRFTNAYMIEDRTVSLRGIGEPLDWVPRGKTVRRTVPPPLLIFLFGWGFHALWGAAKGVAFGNYSLLKKAGENFRLVFNHSACYFLIIS